MTIAAAGFAFKFLHRPGNEAVTQRLNTTMKPFLRKHALVSAFTAVIFSAAISAVSQGQTPANAAGDLAGTWEGALGGQLHIVLTFEKKSDGAYAGSLNSVDQGAVLPMTNITLKENAVRFEVAPVGGVYEGTLSQDGNSINGTWTQSGAPGQPLSFKRGSRATPNTTGANSTPAPKPLTAPLDIVIPIAPTAFKADSKWHLAYELHIANLSGWDCELTSLEVVSGESPEKSLAKFSGADLQSMMAHPGQKPVDAPKITGGAFAVVYVWVTVDALTDLPGAMRQRITTKLGDLPEEITLTTPPSGVNRASVVVISPPLRGDNWLAGNGPSNTSHHRRALIPVEGRAYISQRFAIDWVRLFADGKTYEGDPADNKNYRDYGAEIHSVADGVVTEVKDGIPQNVPGANSRAVPITLETVGGNHVIVKIGNGLYAFYAHAQPGSIRVKLGDTVRAGEVLALVGNSGNSTEPHLHFDICNDNSMLACEGLPYAIASFAVQGKGWGWKSAEAHDDPVEHDREIPLENEVVLFVP
jgi:murein DD-endopeptidase